VFDLFCIEERDDRKGQGEDVVLSATGIRCLTQGTVRDLCRIPQNPFSAAVVILSFVFASPISLCVSTLWIILTDADK
jgi:hypothetical protein